MNFFARAWRVHKLRTAAVQTPVIRKILAAMGHPTEAPTVVASRPPPGQLDFSQGLDDDAQR